MQSTLTAVRSASWTGTKLTRDRLFVRLVSSSATLSDKQKLPSTPARTRFAPSPTGYLHLGSLRTALFNYLLAKRTGGQFLLRIEDTDEKRTVQDAEARLCDDLKWAGVDWDEGPDAHAKLGPYRQSERTGLYQEHAQKLLDSGHAYRCFCTADRLEELSKQRAAQGLPTDYDRQCAGIAKDESNERASKGEGFVVRLLAPEVYPDFYDEVYKKVGKDKGANAGITFKYGEVAYEDPVLLKTDGKPTYHLANVVDDHLMEITHVIRATEWMSSTPKHLALYEAFGWNPPSFAHVGLLVDHDGHKLSKRNFDTTIGSFREIGVLPEALNNFVALMGWSHDKKSDVMDLSELVNEFQMKFTKGNTIVTLDKLWHLQRAHVVRMVEARSPHLDDIAQKTATAVKDLLKIHEGPTGQHLEPYIKDLLILDAKNYTTPKEFCQRNMYFFREPTVGRYRNKHNDVASKLTLRKAAQLLLSTPPEEWSIEKLAGRMKSITADAVKPVKGTAPEESPENTLQREKSWHRAFCDYLRWVLLGGNAGPSLAATMDLLGRRVCWRRMQAANSFRPD